jgi:hypothetical protein
MGFKMQKNRTAPSRSYRWVNGKDNRLYRSIRSDRSFKTIKPLQMEGYCVSVLLIEVKHIFLHTHFAIAVAADHAVGTQSGTGPAWLYFRHFLADNLVLSTQAQRVFGMFTLIQVTHPHTCEQKEYRHSRCLSVLPERGGALGEVD